MRNNALTRRPMGHKRAQTETYHCQRISREAISPAVICVKFSFEKNNSRTPQDKPKKNTEGYVDRRLLGRRK